MSFGHCVRKIRREDSIHINGQVHRAAVVEKYVNSAVPTDADFDCASFPATAGAYGAKCERPSASGPEITSLEGAKAHGFTVVE